MLFLNMPFLISLISYQIGFQFQKEMYDSFFLLTAETRSKSTLFTNFACC